MVTGGGLKPRFKTDAVGATANAANVLERNGIDYRPFLMRHFAGDWGLSHPDDVALNERVIASGEGIAMSVFEENGVRFWIHSILGEGGYTTLLLPEDY